MIKTICLLIFWFVIQQGAQGEPGDAGVPGKHGPKGLQGPIVSTTSSHGHFLYCTP